MNWRRRLLAGTGGYTALALLGAGVRAGDPVPNGRVHHGRSVAPALSTAQTGWLERATRERQERPDILLEELGLDATMVVADIGAGSGYLARRIAPQVSRLYAVELDPSLLVALQALALKPGLTNLVPVAGRADAVPLPPMSVDLALLVDVYHELTMPERVLASLRATLKPGGRVVIVEYRAEDSRVPIPADHKMSERQIRLEFSESSLKFERRSERLPWQHLLVFRNP